MGLNMGFIMGGTNVDVGMELLTLHGLRTVSGVSSRCTVGVTMAAPLRCGCATSSTHVLDCCVTFRV